jgi:hypothetical protein
MAVDVRQPGTSGAAHTQYQAVKSAGHKVPAYRRRVQIQIDASSGEALDGRMAAQLTAELDGMSDRDRHTARREVAHGQALGAHLRAADRFSGYLGHDARLKGPHDQLRYLFGVNR